MPKPTEDAPGPAGPPRGGRGGSAFLLAQVGAHAASRFAERLEPLGLTPPQAGLMRQVAQTPGQSQRALAGALAVHATRLVSLVDDLESRGLVERRRDPDDRRNQRLHLTAAGHEMLGEIARVAREHERDLCAALDAPERRAAGRGARPDRRPAEPATGRAPRLPAPAAGLAQAGCPRASRPLHGGVTRPAAARVETRGVPLRDTRHTRRGVGMASRSAGIRAALAALAIGALGAIGVGAALARATTRTAPTR